MISLHPPGKETAANIGKMMERLGIDQGYRVVPRFGLLFCCALRNCGSCPQRKACTEWLAADHDRSFRPPQFCPNFDLLWELLCDSGIGGKPLCRPPSAAPSDSSAAALGLVSLELQTSAKELPLYHVDFRKE